MAPPRRISKHDIHYFGGVCWLACDRKTFEKAYKYLYDCDYPENTADASGLTCEDPAHKDNQVIFLVGIFDKSHTLILHECIHLSLFIQKRASIDPMADSGESLAYLTEHFVAEFGKKILASPKVKSEIVEHIREW